MKYRDGQEARLGDRKRVGGDFTGLVVCSIDTDEYTREFPREQWSYLGGGVMIQFANYGLVHYTEPAKTSHWIIRFNVLVSGRWNVCFASRTRHRGNALPVTVERSMYCVVSVCPF
jgi:hypothetical protein